MDKLKAEKIFAPTARPSVIGAVGEVVESTASTMDMAVEKAVRGVPDGYVIAAEHQTAGRGREGAWDSCPGMGLLISVLLRAGFRSSERMLLSIMGAVAAVETLRNFGLEAHIKWPNDIVVLDPPDDKLHVKKLGGVLVEQLGRGDAAPAHLLGIGINVNQSAFQLPRDARLTPASMRTELGRAVDRNQVCLVLLRRLDAWYKKLKMGKREELLAQWKNLSCLLGKRVEVIHRGHAARVAVLGLSTAGELIVKDAAGASHYLSDRDSRIVLPPYPESRSVGAETSSEAS